MRYYFDDQRTGAKGGARLCKHCGREHESRPYLFQERSAFNHKETEQVQQVSQQSVREELQDNRPQDLQGAMPKSSSEKPASPPQFTKTPPAKRAPARMDLKLGNIKVQIKCADNLQILEKDGAIILTFQG